jgi:hypothetical protein
MDERRRAPRLKGENEVMITVISEEKNIPKKNSYITIVKISLYPVLKSSPIFLCLSVPSSI